jgi:HD-like signal output (HDOD) protein
MSEILIKREERLRQIQNYISRMPSLSTTVTKVLEICNRPNTSPNDLNRIVSLDPVLTGRVLRLINSAYYALPNQVTSLTRAIIMLGLNTVKNLALSTAVLESIGGTESFKALSMDEFWTHSIAVGVTAKALAVLKDIPVGQREEYFVAGLIHDLGKIPLNNRFPEEYLKALEMAQGAGDPMHLAESRVFGMDHCAVGKMIGEKWELTSVLNDSLSHHHNPEMASKENYPLLSVLALANTYTNVFERDVTGNSLPEDPMMICLLEKAGMSSESLSGLRDAVLKEIEKARIFLQVTRKR